MEVVTEPTLILAPNLERRNCDKVDCIYVVVVLIVWIMHACSHHVSMYCELNYTFLARVCASIINNIALFLLLGSARKLVSKVVKTAGELGELPNKSIIYWLIGLVLG